ncbi:MAG: NAD-dependent epimerase/dehydratase family protein [Pleurocapsa sp. SU_196_0]|nr:NAD-dependent epimerase/dehydratase family protein [Pleurocapsa sp. SU_196_0]
MRILILGGTQFVGRHLVAAAFERGHELTLFHRGNRDPYPHLENILGDRTVDLERLQGEWDAVIDTSGYVPRVVGMSARHLESRVKRYCFISSISVYTSFDPSPAEDADVARLEVDTEEITGETYGALKVQCERVVNEIYGSRSLVVRPGLVVGRFDPTDRFTYWVNRVAGGGEVLTPGESDAPSAFIDGVDLARFVIHALETDLSGTFNADGHSVPLGALLETMRTVSGSDAAFTWVANEFLLQETVRPWMGPDSLPLWTAGSPIGTNITRALAAGLTHRPLEDTIRDTLEFARGRDETHEWRSGINAEREKQLLEAWKGRG